MSEQFYTILTNIGKAKIANAISLGSEVNLVRFVVGDSNGSYYNPTEEQTELRRKVWETNAISVVNDEKNPNWIKIEAIIPGDVGGFTVREVGVFDDKNEMIAIGKIAEIYKPISENGSTKDVIIRMIIEVSNASAVTIKVDPTVMIATKKDIEVVESKFKKISGDKNELVTKNKSNLVAAINEVATDLNNRKQTAENTTIKDTDNNFVSGTVEGALQELATKDKALDKRIDDNKVEIDSLKLSVADGKSKIATSVSGKGVPTNGSDSFQTMADNIYSIKTKLPILEGDVGVANDLQDNIYNITNICNEEKYSPNITDVEMEQFYYVPGARTMLLDSQNDIYVFPGSAGSTYGIRKYNQDGTMVWVKNTYLSSPCAAINSKDEFFYILEATENQVCKMNTNGDVAWRKSLPFSGSSSSLKSILVDSDDNLYILVYYTRTIGTYLYKFDSQYENLIWEKHFPYALLFYPIIKHNKLYVRYTSQDTNPIISKLQEYDLNSNLIWEKTFNYPESSASAWAVDSQDRIFYYDSKQQQVIILNAQREQIGVINERLYDFSFDENDYLYAYISISSNAETYGKYSPNGSKVWQKQFSGNQGPDTIITKNNGFYIVNNSAGTTGVTKYKDNYYVQQIAELEKR